MDHASIFYAFRYKLLLFFLHIDLAPLGDIGYTVIVFFRAFNSWFWLAAIFGFGSKYLNFNNELLNYAREAVLPFYILHQTVIVIIGFYIADWKTGVMVKYIILSALSFTVIIAMYDLLIKRVKILRFLFGMKEKNKYSLRVEGSVRLQSPPATAKNRGR